MARSVDPGGRPPETPPILGGNLSPQTPSAPLAAPPLATGNGSRRDGKDGDEPAPEQ